MNVTSPADKRSLRGWIVQGLIAFLVGFAASFLGWVSVPLEWVGLQIQQPPTMPTAAHATGQGVEIAFVYIGSSTCGVSRRDEVLEQVVALQDRVREQAESRGLGFVSIGVACQWSVEDGLDHLERAGPFDEVIAGRSWLNAGALRWLWEGTPGTAATPQIVVLEREIQVPRSNQVGAYAVRNERLLVRKVGAIEIERWLELGGLIPSV